MTDHNSCLFAGRVSEAPNAFGTVAKIMIAANHAYKNQQGEWKEITRFVPISILKQRLAAKVRDTAKPGDCVVATCLAELSSYTNSSGAKVWETQLVAQTFTNCGPTTPSGEPSHEP